MLDSDQSPGALLEKWNTAFEELGAKMSEAESNPSISLEDSYRDLKLIQGEVQNLEPASRCWGNVEKAANAGVDGFRQLIYSNSESYGRSLLEDSRDLVRAYDMCLQSDF